MFLPHRLFAWFPFIRPGLLRRGNDSSKTPLQESGTVSKSHRLTPGYYWIRLGSLVAPFLPTWWSSRESEASVTTQPNKGSSLKEHHGVGKSHLLYQSKTNHGTKKWLVLEVKKTCDLLCDLQMSLQNLIRKALENTDTKILKHGHRRFLSTDSFSFAQPVP